MFCLESIELTNFRNHLNVLFTPELSGITAISGVNGAGKSTIVDALAWAIFGTKPGGVKNSLLRNNTVDPKKSKCGVLVNFRHGEERYRIERKLVNHTGAVECSLWKKTGDGESLELTLVAGPAVTHTEGWIRQNFKIDESGFLAAVLVQQKQVDQLISAPPKDRGRVIEKLTGIASLSAAVDAGREEYNTLKKSIATSIPVNPEDITEYDARLKEILVQTDVEKNNISQTFATQEALKKSGKSLQDKLAQKETLLEEKDALVQEQAFITTQKEYLSDSLQEIVGEYKKKKSLFGDVSAGKDLKPHLTEAESTQASYLNRAAALDAEMRAVKTEQKRLKDIPDPAPTQSLEKISGELFLLEAKIGQGKTALGAVEADLRALNEASALLDGFHKNCPTCLQEITDPSMIIAEHAIKRTELEDKVKKYDSAIVKLEARHTKTAATLDEKKLWVAAKGSITELDKKLVKIEKDKITINARLKTVNVEVSKLRELVQNQAINKERASILDGLKTKTKTISTQIRELSKKNDEVTKKIAAIPEISKTALRSLREDLEQQKTNYYQLATELEKAKSTIELLEEKRTNIEFLRKKTSAELYRYNKLTGTVEIVAASLQAIEEYRTLKIEQSVPVLENVASELLARFTGGKFVSLELDSKFNATVVLNSGKKMPVSMLSGGELSATALALRIAISVLISNGTPTLLILDEVLISIDTQRAEEILVAIKDVCAGQVIFIAHNDKVNQVADMVFEVPAR